MKYKEQKQVVEDLRALADFYERPEAIILPSPNFNDYYYITEGEWGDFGEEDESGKKKYMFQIDVEASKRKLKQITRILGSCEKDWTRDKLEVIKSFGKIKLTFQVQREALCRKVPTGRVIVHEPSFHSTPRWEEEEFEWVCDDVSLLS